MSDKRKRVRKAYERAVEQYDGTMRDLAADEREARLAERLEASVQSVNALKPSGLLTEAASTIRRLESERRELQVEKVALERENTALRLKVREAFEVGWYARSWRRGPLDERSACAEAYEEWPHKGEPTEASEEVGT